MGILDVPPLLPRRIFNVKDVLNSKGFEVIRESSASEFLIEFSNRFTSGIISEPDILFNAFDNKKSRQEILENITTKVTATDKDALLLIQHSTYKADRKRFSNSFEWYAGELMVRKFSSFSHSFGVEVKDVFRKSAEQAVPGDYDSLVVSRDVQIIYFECKSGNYDTDKINKFAERSIALHCKVGIFFIQEKISPRKLTAIIKNLHHPLYGKIELSEINIKNKDVSKVYEWGNLFFVSASEDIEDQIRIILRVNEAKKIPWHFSELASNSVLDQLGV